MRTIAGTTWPVDCAREYVTSRSKQSDCGCREWSAATDRLGYGRADVPRAFRVAGASSFRTVHRLAYEAFVGPIRDEMHVLHRCDNRRCCNPEHLWLGTHADNMQDKAEKGRTACPKLTREGVREIIRALAVGETQASIASRFGLSNGFVSRIANGRVWRTAYTADELDALLAHAPNTGDRRARSGATAAVRKLLAIARDTEVRAPQWRMDPVYVHSETRACDVGEVVYAADADGMPLSKLDPTAVIQPGSTVWVRRG